MTTAFYSIDGRFYGQVEVHPQSRSHVFVCPECGDAWGRVIVEKAPWDVRVNACIKHRNRSVYTHGQPPGSIVSPLALSCIEACAEDPILIQRLPLEVLRREVLVTLKEYVLNHGSPS